MKYYLSAFRQYIRFRGRATRTEYWIFVLVHVLVLGGLVALSVWREPLTVLFTLYYLGATIPSLALGARRLHDAGYSGWLQLIAFLPFGGLVLIVLLALPGVHGPNRHGPDPRDAVVRPAGPDPWADDPDRTRR